MVLPVFIKTFSVLVLFSIINSASFTRQTDLKQLLNQKKAMILGFSAL